MTCDDQESFESGSPSFDSPAMSGRFKKKKDESFFPVLTVRSLGWMILIIKNCATYFRLVDMEGSLSP